MSGDIVDGVRNFLMSHHMHTTEEWLEGFIEYVVEDNQNLTEKEIQNLAKDQWLLNDLKNICPGSLPPNLEGRVTVLPDLYVLQINGIEDIGLPTFQQYLDLVNAGLPDVVQTPRPENVFTNSRMIKLYLTDGVQDLTAVEYERMPTLNYEITPGTKILIKGPVDCRNGIIFLTESAIELLGGEVEELVISNSYAALVFVKLGFNMAGADTNPTICQLKRTKVRTSRRQRPHERVYEVAYDEIVPVEMVNNPPGEINNAPVMEMVNNPPEEINNAPVVEMVNNPQVDIDNAPPVEMDNNPQVDIDNAPVVEMDDAPPMEIDDSLQAANFNDEDIDIAQLDAIEAELQDNSGKRPLSIDISKPEKLPKIEPSNDNEYPDENEQFYEEDADYLKEIEEKIDAADNIPKKSIRPMPLTMDPFGYIKEICEMSDVDKAGRVFKIKGQIVKLLSKLSVGKDGWSLKCMIVDGTGNLDVNFSSIVLTNLVGYTPQEMGNLKKQIIANPELEKDVHSILMKVKDKLQVLYCIFEITILETPRVTGLTPFDTTHVKSLKERMENIGN